LAPPGRSPAVVYVRAFWMHFIPVWFHFTDIAKHEASLRQVYQQKAPSMFLKFWCMVGGYLAMGLTWEQFANLVTGGAGGAATYNVTTVSPETFANVSKMLAISACLLVYFISIKPKLID